MTRQGGARVEAAAPPARRRGASALRPVLVLLVAAAALLLALRPGRGPDRDTAGLPGTSSRPAPARPDEGLVPAPPRREAVPAEPASMPAGEGRDVAARPAAPAPRPDKVLALPRVTVRALAAEDGRPLRSVLEGLPTFLELGAVASTRPLADVLPGGFDALLPAGVASPVGDAGADGIVAVLALHADPPLEIGLVLGRWVVASQGLVPGVEEVTFRVPTDRLRLALGSLRLRAVQAETLLPAAGAHVNVAGGAGSFVSLRADEDGALVLDPWYPGPGSAEIWTRASGWVHVAFAVAPGGRADLGDVVLPAAVPVTGRVLDPRGAPRGSVQLQATVPGTAGGSLLAKTDADGEFSFRLQPGRWVLTAAPVHCAPEDGGAIWTAAPVTLELGLRAPPPVDLRLAVSARLTLTARSPGARRAVHRVLDGRGTTVVQGDLVRAPADTIQLPPGPYRVELLAPDGAIVRSTAVDLGPEGRTVDLDTGS